MDYLSKLHWEAIVQQHVDPQSEKTRDAIIKFNQALDTELNQIFPKKPSDVKGKK